MKKRSREAAAPDITPMIDVVFLLLIFFMVSTVFKKDEMALLLNLPKTEKGESVQKEQKTIYIELSKTEIAYNGEKTTLENIEGSLKAIVKKTMPIDLRIDKDVKYDRVVQLIGKLKKYELTNVSLITDE
ncbi:biopolymer transporter ExbD [Halobacteriovorax marinus]|uniref:Transport-related membrane protein n=1 Tax=Halobacteriovorax marinus (strain ATCC BAA-682 / DSM 15412 / SJ) TaxID=862908 RepID=E1X4W5_HALMS|nr:biopolymer transporter ExbD [Halobacteriovorax marinus]ATH08497.1 biopolymer transporter ExbD [Halobacteriovorax marinus]CBW27191.1 putative transport-related membrane protein [Halobacteriovorax marinus SJ]